MSTAQFLTLLLRALGYEDGKDFTWSTPWTLTDQLGITDGDYTAQTATFLRADAAVVSANALYCPQKGGGQDPAPGSAGLRGHLGQHGGHLGLRPPSL